MPDTDRRVLIAAPIIVGSFESVRTFGSGQEKRRLACQRIDGDG